MSYRVEVAASAIEDMNQLVKELAPKSTRAATSVLHAFEKVLANLGELPEMYPKYRYGLRRAGLPQDHSLYYAFANGSVSVYAVISDGRGPQYRYRRLTGLLNS